MIAGLTYEFSVDKDNNSIIVKREYSAELFKVWDAYTKSEILDQWWAPKPWKSRTKEMDFREGGRWLYAMTGPEGEEHWAVAKFRNIQPQRGFTVSDAFSDDQGNVNRDMPQATWDVTFTPQGNTTLVTFRIRFENQRDLDETLNMGFREGLSMAMENLDEILSR